MIDDDTAYCADSCGRVATTERLTDLLVDGTDVIETVELICEHCRG